MCHRLKAWNRRSQRKPAVRTEQNCCCCSPVMWPESNLVSWHHDSVRTFHTGWMKAAARSGGAITVSTQPCSYFLTTFIFYSVLVARAGSSLINRTSVVLLHPHRWKYNTATSQNTRRATTVWYYVRWMCKYYANVLAEYHSFRWRITPLTPSVKLLSVLLTVKLLRMNSEDLSIHRSLPDVEMKCGVNETSCCH